MTTPHYSWPLIAVHWLTLLLILAAGVLGLVLEDMPLSPIKLKLYAWHKWIGLLVLALVPLRVLLRRLDPLERPRELTLWEQRLSATVHGLLYFLMLAAPLLGWLHSSAAGFSVVWFGVLPLPDLVMKDKAMADLFGDLHETAVNILFCLVAAHALAALFHHYVRGDQVLLRMLPWLRRP